MTDNTNTTNQPIPTRHFMLNLIDSFSLHIEGLVERKVNEIMQSHATMRLIDEKTETLMRNIADEAITEHEHDYDHPTNDDVSDQIATHIAHIDFTDNIRRSVEEIISDGDYPTEERVQEMIDDHDYEESVKEVLRNI